MMRLIATVAGFCLLMTQAFADVWMVKASGTWGCKDRAVLAEVRDTAAAACVALLAGERLLDMAEVGVGFSDHVRVQRHDGSIVYVSTDAIAADPGIGTLSEDRPE